MKHPLDIHVGSRIARRRIALGLTQRDMMRRMGVDSHASAVHMARTERGEVSITNHKLYKLAKVLRVPVSYFFEGI